MHNHQHEVVFADDEALDGQPFVMCHRDDTTFLLFARSFRNLSEDEMAGVLTDAWSAYRGLRCDFPLQRVRSAQRVG